MTLDTYPGARAGDQAADADRSSGEMGRATRVGWRHGGRWWPIVACGVLYLALSLLLFGHLDDLGSAHLAGPGGADQFIQVWWIGWAEHALAHGQNPYFSNWINFPVGLNAGPDNTMLGVGILVSPITAALGPVVSWNVLARLTLCVSAFAMCLVLRRWTRWWPAAFVGGLLYGFCVYETLQGSSYVFLTFVPLPPVIFLLLYEGLVRQRWKPARAGVVLALVCAAQFFVSAEIFVSTVLLGLIAIVLHLVAERRSFADRWPYARRFGAWAILGVAILLAVPVAFTLFGPQAANGVPNSSVKLAHGDLLALVVPTQYQRFTTSGLSSFARLHLGASVSLYLGLPFVLAVAATVVWLRNRGIVLLAGAMAAVSFLLSLGSTLYIDGRDTHVPLPYTVLAHLPLLQGLNPLRFSLFTCLFGGAVVAFGLDEASRRWWGDSAPSVTTAVRRQRIAGLVVAVALAVIVVLPALPLDAQPVVRITRSSVFSSTEIPAGGVVLTYPYADSPSFPGSFGYSFSPRYQAINYPLLNQAAAGTPFKLIGSYGWRPDGSVNTTGPSSLTPASVQAFFDFEFYGVTTYAGQAKLLVSSHLVTDLRQFLRRYDVDTAVVMSAGRHPATVTAFLTAAIGPPSHVGGTAVWSGVKRRLESPAPRAGQPFEVPPPVTHLAKPANGAHLGGRQYLVAAASANLGVSKVVLHITGMGRALVETTTPSLYGWLAIWDTTKVPNGTYIVRSVAYGSTGKVTTSAGVVVHVQNK